MSLVSKIKKIILWGSGLDNLKEYILSKYKIYFTTIDGIKHEGTTVGWFVQDPECTEEERIIKIANILYNSKFLIDSINPNSFYVTNNIISFEIKLISVQKQKFIYNTDMEEYLLTDEELNKAILESKTWERV